MKTPLQLLICEDTESDVLLLVRELEKAGYDVAYRCALTALDMKAALQSQSWDIVISDFNIPGFGGAEALAICKDSGIDIPFILVSGVVGEEAAVGMMKKGAHDYLMKDNLVRLGEVVKREMEENQNRKERKKAEEQLRANEEKYRVIINNSLFSIFLTKPGGLIQEANRAACDLFGYTQEEFRNLYLHKLLYHIDPLIVIKSVNPEGGSNREEFISIKKNGELFHCEVSSILFKDINGEELSCSMLADISQRKDAEQQLRDTNSELKKLSNHLKNVREDERKYISREIHDQLGQLASAIKMELDWLNIHLVTADEKAKSRIARALDTVTIMIDTTRKIATSLRPSLIDELGLNDSLKWQCSEFQNLNGITCDFEEIFDDTGIVLEIKTELFRICQESLTNVMRHANASHIQVSIKDITDAFALYIVDDGKGFDTSQKNSHLGLVGIRERAHSINGHLQIRSEPGKGTSICVTVPKE
ncbi:MAG: PAS domain S-box protein [Chitinophagaceae bacterium]|nr:PAS domain S-box protein [Chitinophagaceae bacterium]